MTSSTEKNGTTDGDSNKRGKDGFFGTFNMPQVDMDALVNHHRRNLEILGSINKMSAEVYSGIVQLQSTFVKQMMTEMNELIQEKGKPSEMVAKFSEFAKDHVVKVVDNSKQISDLLATTQQSVNTAILKHFRESVDELKRKNTNSTGGGIS
ncbi:MAG: TIGR01841 family phasin [Holosporaceae bacterium]|jgi:phasin family protein|nr:TIGR01841 family phasin [Holosporaceae bacterium]